MMSVSAPQATAVQAQPCEKHDLRWCADCANPVQAAKVEGRGTGRLGPWFRASYSGDCSGCGTRIAPGDKIRRDGEEGYLCDICGDV